MPGVLWLQLHEAQLDWDKGPALQRPSGIQPGHKRTGHPYQEHAGDGQRDAGPEMQGMAHGLGTGRPSCKVPMEVRGAPPRVLLNNSASPGGGGTRGGSDTTHQTPSDPPPL